MAKLDTLKLGDIVLFSLGLKGYVYSELTSSSYNFLTVFPITSPEAEPNFPNVSFAAFRVLAPNKFQAKQRYELLKGRLKRRDSVSVESTTTTLRSSQSKNNKKDTTVDNQLSRAKKEADTEFQENIREQERRKGNRVVYGDVIQLQHVASGKYVTIRSEASITESNNLLVSLTDESIDGCWFKLLPRYKVRSEGDEVHYNDQMKIESVKTPGQFLHCSDGHKRLFSAGFHTNPNFFELNLSAAESAITLLPHYHASDKHPVNSLRAGNCIRLFHREDECYIVAEGSFANQGDAVVYQKIHCRQRRVDQRRHAKPSTSANTYWQIEKEENPKTGDVLYWEERCRLKHLPTRLYLAVDRNHNDEWIVNLRPRKDNQKDHETLFSFHPLIEEGIEVLLESYARIKHLVSSRWLHLEKEHFNREHFDPKAVGLAGLQWDSAELFTLTTSISKGDYDAFTLQEVPQELTEKFNYVAGIVPVLSTHIDFLSSDDRDHDRKKMLTQKQSNMVKMSLIELGEWMDNPHSSDRDIKNCQKLLRNLMVIEQLIEILKKSEMLMKSVQLVVPFQQHVDICRECYSVIKKFLEGDSRKNENYLARYIEFFQTQVRKGLNAEIVLVEIVQDNTAIITRMAETRMIIMINQFRDTKDPLFLKFLSSLCVSSGRSIPSTQKRLLDELVVKYGRKLLLTTKLEKVSGTQENYVVVYYKPGIEGRISIRDIKSHEADYKLMKAQLDLFIKLCKGSNRKVIEYLKGSNGFVTFTEALACVNDKEVDIKIRSRYVDLILVMFVDVDNNTPFMDHLCYSFIYGELSPQPYSDSGGDDAEALTKVRNEHFTDMKKWLLDTVKKNTQLDCSESSIKKNEMIVKVLDVLGHLVRFGYYDSEEDIDEMIGPLIDLLDDQGEKKDDKTNDKKSNDSNGNKAMFEVKLKALEVMDLFFTFKFYVTLQKLMNDFKILEGTGRMVIGGNGSRDGPPTTLRSLLHEIDPTKCEDWIYSIEMTQAVQNRLEQLSSSAIKGHSHPNLEKVLLDLSQYECDELITASLELLTKMYFFEEELFDKAIQSQLLVNPDSIHDYGIVNDEILPDLRQLMRVDPDQEKQQILMNKLDQLAEMLRLSDNMDELNKENQIMLNNFGLVDDILSYLLTKTESNTESLDSGVALQPAVFQKCFDLLRVCTTDYRDIQIRLFNRIDLLLSFKVPTIALANLADLLTEIFTGGYEIVLKVKESHINRIFEIVINCPNLHVQAQFMMTLEAITRSEDYDYPIRKNQVLIIKNFCLFRDKFCESLLSGEAADHRFEILTQDNDTAELRLLLHLTDMLAACAEGKDLFIESVCQNIFTIEELVKIISTPLPSTRKRPFVRFLIQIYLKADIESSSSGGVTITHGPLMWDYLMQVADLLGSITTALNIAAYDHEKMIKMDKKSAFRNRSKSVTHKTQSRTSSALTIPSVTNDDGTLEAGLLEYLIEGILPLLNNFYLNYFSPKDIINDQQKEMQYNVSAKIVRNLITLKEIILKFLTSQQISVFRDTVMSLCVHEEICRLANINTQVETASITSVRRQAFGSGTKHSQRPNQSITTQHTHTTGNEIIDSVITDINELSQYRLEAEHPAVVRYWDQVRKNKQFNSFVRNYGLCYKGHNTAVAQIGSTVDIKYSQEGEELPLGPSFQALVEIFYSDPTHDADSPDKSPVKKVAEMLLKQLILSVSRTEQLSERDQTNQDTLDIRCLQILRALIHNKILLIDPELKESDSAVYQSKSEKLVIPVQNSIQTFCGNAIKNVISLLSHSNEAISHEAFALMKVLLFDGNEEAQDGLTRSAKETREETFFINLKKKLEDATVTFREEREIKVLQQMQAERKKISSEMAKRARKITESEIHIDIENSPNEGVKYKTEPVKQPENIDVSNIQEEDELSIDNSWLLVLEVIGYMCDGQHRTLQNYLRHQPDNFKTVNVVAEVTALLHTYTTELTLDNSEALNKILQALIEMCVGNVSNQTVIFDKLVIEPLNRILQYKLGEDTPCGSCIIPDKQCEKCTNMVDLVSIKGRAIELISVMIENISPETDNIIQGIGPTIDVQAVIETMCMFHELKSNELIEKKEMDDDCERGMFRSYHTLVSLMECKAIPYHDRNELLKECDNETKRVENIEDECHSTTRTIEIKYQGDDDDQSKPELARVHFPYDSKNNIREAIRDKVSWSINRDSMEDKQRALLDLMPPLKKDINHQKKLNRFKYLKPFFALHIWRSRFLMFLTVILNLFLLITYQVPNGATQIIRPDVAHAMYFWFFNYLIYILGAVHLIMSIWIVLEYFIISWPHFKLPMFCYQIWFFFKSKIHEKRQKKTLERPPYLFSTCLDVGILGVTTIYMIVFLCCSILGLALQGYFYCICLLFVIFNNDILQRVLRAVTKNGVSLIWVAVLGIIVLFIYSVVSFAFLHSSFYETDDALLYCRSLVQCLYSILRYGLIDNIGLLLPLAPSNSTATATFSDQLHIPRLIFDLSFFIIVTTIGLNIVFGIIVDTFGELREERSEIEADQKSKCFICDLQSHEFERKTKTGFGHHVKHDHNMWDYVYYSLYIDGIDPGDHNAIQKYVYQLISDKQTGFFPQQEATCLTDDDKDSSDVMDDLSDKIDFVVQYFKDKEQAKSVFAKREKQKKWEEQVLNKPTADAS